MKPRSDAYREYQKNYLKIWNKNNNEKRKRYRQKWMMEHPEKERSQKRRWRTNLWDEFLSHYGNQCACCGESEKRFLTMEHLNGDGAIHRKQIGCRSRAMIVLDLKRKGWPSGYAVLCYNCNCAKDKNGGVCPHEEVRRQLFNVLVA